MTPPATPAPALARYVMVGGFLGAGKTTALLRLAQVYQDRGLKVGLITNDQSTGLVDTAMATSQLVPVEEITGGCFCCKFTSLTDAATRLSADKRPDVFLAEPVGSCTDLAATVAYPLRRLYGDRYSVAPYTVVLDPTRLERMLNLAPGPAFSSKVRYIYEKQMEEADILAVNKIDGLTASRVEALLDHLRRRFPRAKCLSFSSRTGQFFDDWVAELDRLELGTAPAMELDYETYAEGEALLGWANATVSIRSGDEFDGNDFLMDFAQSVRASLAAHEADIAHLKMTLAPETGPDLGVINVVRTDAPPEQSYRLAEPLTAGELVINLRAEADPELLRRVLEPALRISLPAGTTITIDHLEAFRPGKPVPTHRDLTAPAAAPSGGAS